MDVAVSVRGLGKRYRHSGRRAPTLRDAVVGGLRRRRGEAFWALRDVSFDVERGGSIGVIGPNGAGKSTLLRLVGGVGLPDEGEVSVTGRVTGIFELGRMFHPELTGREATILSGVVSGLTRREVLDRLPDVVAFAELDEFVDDRVGTYSSGMVARLAFAVATHVDADVLLVDEALAVGDLAFQERCAERLMSFRRAGTTMVIVSHSPEAIREFCEEVIWLRSGKVVARGSPEAVTTEYARAMHEVAQRLTPPDLETETTPEGVELRPHENRLGTQEARLVSVRTADRWGAPSSSIESGEGLCLDVEADVPSDVGAVVLSVLLLRDDGVHCLDTNTTLTAARDGTRRRTARLELPRLDLAPGGYGFEVGLYSPDWERPYDYHAGVYSFTVTGQAAGKSILAPPMRWERDQAPSTSGG